MILLLLLLQLKHLIIDFPLQRPFQYLNKGIYGHPGGIIHSLAHGCGTYICFALCSLPFTWFAWWVVIAEMILHYHIDWAKVNYQKWMGWDMKTHEEYWWLLGFDQFLHQLTYIAIIALVF